MAFSEDLPLFLSDFGVQCTAGAITATGILDMPTQIISGDMVLSTDYTLTARAADFGGLLYGDGITVDGVAYQVREVRKLDDGAFVEVGLMRLSPGATAPGGQPREFTLNDLADVEVTSPVAGEVLQYDGQQWVDAEGGNDGESRIDTSTAGTIYVGQAPSGSAEGASVWSITRTTYNAAGVRTSKGTAINVSWTDRASHSYS